tara:strand:+ start:17 stop:1105 length:1089 start_codon:yes stop_codon:yes gene_type:complete
MLKKNSNIIIHDILDNFSPSSQINSKMQSKNIYNYDYLHKYLKYNYIEGRSSRKHKHNIFDIVISNSKHMKKFLKKYLLSKIETIYHHSDPRIYLKNNISDNVFYIGSKFKFDIFPNSCDIQYISGVVNETDIKFSKREQKIKKRQEKKKALIELNKKREWVAYKKERAKKILEDRVRQNFQENSEKILLLDNEQKNKENNEKISLDKEKKIKGNNVNNLLQDKGKEQIHNCFSPKISSKPILINQYINNAFPCIQIDFVSSDNYHYTTHTSTKLATALQTNSIFLCNKVPVYVELLGSEYPFYFNNESELKSQIIKAKKLINNPKKYQNFLLKYKTIKDQLSISFIARQYAELISSIFNRK